MDNDYFNLWFSHFITQNADKKMLLIRKVEYVDVPSDVTKIYDFIDDKNNRPLFDGNNDFLLNMMAVEQEIVRGKRYRNEKGDEICIGIPQEIQGILGLPFSDFKRLENNINALRIETKNLKKELKSYKEMSFWNRLKFLITGKYSYK